MNSTHPENPPLVAIVGRPNVGKSTLFNRLVGRRVAVVHREAGTTRDRLYADVVWQERRFRLIDTGGLLTSGGKMDTKIFQQAEKALAEASLCLLVVDVQEGLSPLDEEVARLLHRLDKPVILVVNKADNADLDLGKSDFLRLGFETCLPISALHGLGSGELLEEIVREAPPSSPDGAKSSVSVAIVGRSNVGKSTLINRLVGEDRVVVDEVPGTTRDAVDIALKWRGKEFDLIDTAGLQRKSDSQSALDLFSLSRTRRAIGRADIVLLLIEATQPPTRVDANLIKLALSKGKGCLIGINKWDLIDGASRREYQNQVRHHLAFAGFLPMLLFSALKDRSLKKILEAIDYVTDQREQVVTTGILNRVLQQAQEKVSPPRRKGKRFKIFYATQIKGGPPLFRLFVNNRRILSPNYEQYLVNCLRRAFGFDGTPLKFEFREKKAYRKAG